MSKDSSKCHPKICSFGVIIILSCRYLKNGKCGESLYLNSAYLPKDRSPQKNSVAINLFPGSFVTQGRLIHPKKGHWKSTPHPDKLCDKLSDIPSILLQGPFILPKKHLFSPKKPMSLLSFPY